MNCPNCQKELDGNPSFCDRCGHSLRESAASQPTFMNPLLIRYRNGYQIANTMNQIGGFVKVAGMILAVLAIGSGFRLPTEVSLAVVPFGIFCGGVLYVWGVVISGQAQMQLAALDSAIYASPFLTDAERAQIMSLPIRSNSASA